MKSVSSRYYFIGIILSIGILGFYLHYSHTDNYSNDLVKTNLKEAYNSPFKMTGITFRNYDHGKLRTKVKADEIKVDDRKFWIFNVRPFKEAILEKATVQVYLDRSPASNDSDLGRKMSANLPSFGKDLMIIGKKINSNPNRKEIISRGVVRDFALEIFDSGELSMLIKSQKAHIDFRKKILKMMYVQIKDVNSGRVLKSREATWNDNRKVFEVAGDYTVSSSDGISRGRSISIDLDFDITPLGRGVS